ncbi:MAG: hypothetical protein ACI4VN_04705 [Clostridia bacterium]|nr:hypothetical protein [Clostridia bacterium]
MSAIAIRILEEAKKIPEFIGLRSVSSHEVSLLFNNVPTYDQQLSLQRVLDPLAQRTTTIKVWGFSFEDKVKVLNIKF